MVVLAALVVAGCGTDGGADGADKGDLSMAPSCSDGKKNGVETDIDCGGLCSPCANGKHCSFGPDCASGVCSNNTCAAACSDGMQNGDETDIDCGGSCPGCADGKRCSGGADCASGLCTNNVCQPSAGTDGGAVDAGGGADLAMTSKSKIVFITSALYEGNLGGLGGADQDCAMLASKAGLSGKFMAWLSDSNNTAGARLSHATVPYELTDGTVVANDWAGLTSGTLLHSINLTESGKAPPKSQSPCGNGTDDVWSNTKADGTFALNACLDWTSSDPNGSASWGFDDFTSMAWSYGCLSSNTGSVCNSMAPLYCIEQ